MNKTRNGHFTKGGFTIIEILTVIAILVLITAAMLSSNNFFGANLLLTNLAYDVSSTIREAQFYGLSKKNWLEDLTTEMITQNEGFDTGYGIRFGNDNSKAFGMFYETGPSNWHCGTSNPGPTNLAGCKSSSGEWKSEYVISGRNSILKFCAISDGDSDCHYFDGSGTSEISYLDIIFKKSSPDSPAEPDAYISTNSNVYPAGNYQRAEITFKTITNLTKTVVVNQIGQISIR
ncbi:MAG TPA: prepilin-type N-terminal cleavage/methylation domain-containing protein [Candidatus Paceibacterota bacterium]